MLYMQKPLSWFLLAFLTEQGRWYSTDFDGERYWFLASHLGCGGRNRTGVWGLWAPRGTSPLPRYITFNTLNRLSHLLPRLRGATLLYPAIFILLPCLAMRNTIPIRRNFCNLNGIQLAEDGLVMRDGTAHESIGELESRTLVRDLIAHFVRLPGIFEGAEIPQLGTV